MSKIFTAGIAALFAALAITATTVPAAAKHKGGHHGHHGNHGGHHGNHHGNHGGHWGGSGIYFDFGSVVYDEPNPIYCVGRHGKLYVCGWN